MSEETMKMHSVSRHPDTRHMRGLEVDARRGERSKTFFLDKGRYQSVIYPERVHYRDSDGNWSEINNHLQPAADGEPALETISGPLRMRLAAWGDANPLVTLADEQNHTLCWRLEGAGKVACTQVATAIPSDNEDVNRSHADKSTARVQYSDILPHTHLVCEMLNNRLKETLVLNSPQAPAQYRFVLNPHHMAWEALSSGDLRLWSNTQPTQEVFTLPHPYMMDAAGLEGDVHTVWQALDDKLLLVMTPDAAFLQRATYPVLIDPTVQSTQTTAAIQDVFLSETNKTTTYAATQTLRVGTHSAYGQCRALVKITGLPDLNSAYTITKAWMELAVLPTTSYTQDAYLYAHEVQADWASATATWAAQPAFEPKHLDYALIKKGETTAKVAYVDITNLVRKWYANKSANFGVMLDSPDGQAIELCASENTAYTATARPVIRINYVSNTGLENHFSYESFDAGRAGTAHVALHNGHLVVTRALAATNGNRMPVSLGLTWNLCRMEENPFGVGYGWRLNWNQQLRLEKPASGDYYYMHTDEDGTEHEYRKHVKTTEEQAETGFIDYYEDQSGLSLKLYEGTAQCEIVSKDHSKLVFDKPLETPASSTVKQILSAQDALGNTTTFTYDESNRLTKVTDGVGRETVLVYTASAVQITVPGYTEKVVLTLDANQCLTAVTDLDSNHSEYLYGTDVTTTSSPDALGKRLRLMRNAVNGLCVQPSFDERGRVSRMVEYVLVTDQNSGTTNTVKGNERSYAYFDCVTQVHDETVVTANSTAVGKTLTYQFNDYGNVVAAHDELGFASFAQFRAGKPNTPDAVSKLQRLVINLLDMHDFNSDSGWKTGVIGTDNIARENEVAQEALKPLCLECPAPKWLTQGETTYAEYLKDCDPGEYTFSVYTQSKGDVLVWVAIAQLDKMGNWHEVTSEQVRRVGKPLRLTCTLETNEATTLRCRVFAKDGTGTAWFDRAQLETGPIANRHNLLQSSNFSAQTLSEWPEGWLPSDGVDESAIAEKTSITASEVSVNKPSYLGGNCLCLQGAPGKKVGAYQDLVIRGAKNDNYVVGGWARAWAAPSGENRTFRLRVQFQKKNGVWVDGGTTNWNEEWVDWQYACGAVVAPADYRTLRVAIEYNENLNEAQIGAVSLTKEYYGQNYAYDEKNNVTAVSTLLGQKDKAVYDQFDNLTSYIQPGRAESDKYSFDYGDTDAEKKRHLLLRSESPLGLVTETQYDRYGNAILNTSRDKATGWFMRTGTTYTPDGNYATGAMDALGQTTSMVLDSKGRTSSATDAAGQQIDYEYDNLNRITHTRTAVSEGAQTKEYRNDYTYEKDRLSTVTHNTSDNPANDVTYTFETDALGNQTAVKVGGQTLSTNVYTESGDKLLAAVEYSNDGKVAYTYDSFKRITGVTYDNDPTSHFAYEYGANGAVGRVKDTKLGREARMAYDLVERPVEAELYENGALTYRLTQEYDQFEQPSVLQERLEEPDNTRSEHTISVTYDKESRPTDVTCESRHMTAVGVPDTTSKRKLAYRYDGLGRVFQRDFYTDGDANTATATPLLRSAYAYCEGGYGANSTSPRVRSLEQAGRKYVYEYDKLGNIIRECWQGKATEGGALSFDSDPIASPDGDPLTLDAANLGTRYNTTYAYDALGQLLRANDERAQATWTYEYDQGGNILEKKRYAFTTVADLSALTPEQTVPYAYGDAGWKDKLTSFDGKLITHDTIGNPLTYDGWAYTWKAGRMLQSMVLDGENPVNAEFTYDHTGLRVKKTVNRVDTFYTLNGKKITHIRKGTNGAAGADAVQLHFFYDAQGRPMMVRYMDVDYAYLHNLQGDVVGIVDMNGVPVVEYGYDAWGKPVFTEGSMAETLGRDNPFRYRGYVWDEETGLYYLRSRYYDPSWGRFVNADTVLGKIGRLLDHHLFGYCRQNPVTGSDPSGMYDPDEPIEEKNRRRNARKISAYSIFSINHPNPKAPTIAVSDFLGNLQKLVDKEIDVSSPKDTGCGMFIRCGILGKMSKHGHKVYHAGITPMFKNDMILMGKIQDVGGPDGLVPGMILSTHIPGAAKPFTHGGVYADLYDFGNGPEPAVYSFNTEKDVGNLRPFTDGDWVYYGWHMGVVLD